MSSIVNVVVIIVTTIFISSFLFLNVFSVITAFQINTQTVSTNFCFEHSLFFTITIGYLCSSIHHNLNAEENVTKNGSIQKEVDWHTVTRGFGLLTTAKTALDAISVVAITCPSQTRICLSILVEFASGWKRHLEYDTDTKYGGAPMEGDEVYDTFRDYGVHARYRRLLGRYATSLVHEIATSIGFEDTRTLIEHNMDFLLLQSLVYHRSNEMKDAVASAQSANSFMHHFPIHLCGEWCTSISAFVEMVAPNLFPVVILQAAWEEMLEMNNNNDDDEDEDEAGGNKEQSIAGTFRWNRIQCMTELLSSTGNSGDKDITEVVMNNVTSIVACIWPFFEHHQNNNSTSTSSKSSIINTLLTSKGTTRTHVVAQKALGSVYRLLGSETRAVKIVSNKINTQFHSLVLRLLDIRYVQKEKHF